VSLNQASVQELQQLESQVAEQYEQLKAQQLKLDLTRGKPASTQLDLAADLDGILAGDYLSESGVDSRNYGGLRGLPESCAQGAEIMGLPAANVIAGGNASLQLMYLCMLTMFFCGYRGPDSAWKNLSNPKMLCPVPGYDRHFSLCENFGIKMINVSMLETGPDMDLVEELIREDDEIVGIWCVPKYSNPTGSLYSDETIDRIAKLGQIASDSFRIFWDNAYVVHDLVENPPAIKSLWQACEAVGTSDSAWQFASTSKISFAGAGVSWVGASETNLKALEQVLQVSIISFDKVNQLRHLRKFPNLEALQQHMAKHREIMAPKFSLVLETLDSGLNADYGSWTRPEGGYFVSFNTLPGLASEVVKLANDAGVKLTPAGATFPYRKDPENSNIRIAPSMPPLAELEQAMKVFVTCVKLATIKQRLDSVAG
jgi:DNA-binding transcriptional MocR family regulator